MSSRLAHRPSLGATPRQRRLAPQGAAWRRLWRFPLTSAENATNGDRTGSVMEGWRMHSAFCIMLHRYVVFIVPALGVCGMSAASRHACGRARRRPARANRFVGRRTHTPRQQS